MQHLIREAEPAFDTWHIAEPNLIFGGNNRCVDPKTGITLFGPAGLNHNAPPSLRIGVIGTGETVQLLMNWLKTAEGKVVAGRDKKGRAYDVLLAPEFPGFCGDTPFRCTVDMDPRSIQTLTTAELTRAADAETHSARIQRTVELVERELRVLTDREPAPDVVVCAMPSVTDLACGPQRTRSSHKPLSATPFQKAMRRLHLQTAKAKQLVLGLQLPQSDDEDTEHNDFHNTLKVRAMKYHVPTQLVWESTLTGSRSMQDPATVAWNFFTALYYKAGFMPWELDFSASGTCFVGVTFYREGQDPMAATRTSLAQVFSETGEGLILKGEPVLWDLKRDRRPHLDENTAETLLERAVSLYEDHNGRRPSRVVVHKTSRYWPEELKGFQRALGEIRSYDFLALERRGIRFLRLGYEPPLRGTVVQLSRRDYLIYTRGYIPFLRCYPGMRVPNPLEVVEHHGDSSAQRVCSEILALTKLNWNNSSFASADPVTTAFSRQVGEILTELDPQVRPESKYRFYM